MYDYSMNFVDFKRALKIFEEKVPNLNTISQADANGYGDLVIHTNTDTWMVKREDWSVWHLDRSAGKWGEWVEVE